MGFYVDGSGLYYVGDRIDPSDIEVEQRPSSAFIYVNGSWVADLSAIKSERIAGLKASLQSAIVAGIESDALGIPHAYPTALTDQANLNGLVTETLLPGAAAEFKFWCADSAGNWLRRVHTAEQIRQVGIDVATHIKAQQSHYEALLISVENAEDVDAVAAVVW